MEIIKFKQNNIKNSINKSIISNNINTMMNDSEFVLVETNSNIKKFKKLDYITIAFFPYCYSSIIIL